MIKNVSHANKLFNTYCWIKLWDEKNVKALRLILKALRLILKVK